MINMPWNIPKYVPAGTDGPEPVDADTMSRILGGEMNSGLGWGSTDVLMEGQPSLWAIAGIKAYWQQNRDRMAQTRKATRTHRRPGTTAIHRPIRI